MGAAAGRGILYEAMELEDAAPMNLKRANKAASAIDLDVALERTDSGELDVDEEALAGVTLREGDVKVALWKPLLSSEDDGSVYVEFDAPPYNRRGPVFLQAF